jgi:hypothetical protein
MILNFLHFLDNPTYGGEVFNLTAGHSLSLALFLVFISLQDYSAVGNIRKVKKFNYLIGNRTHDILAE